MGQTRRGKNADVSAAVRTKKPWELSSCHASGVAIGGAGMRLAAAAGGLLLLLDYAAAQSDSAEAEPFCTGDPLAASSAACLLARYGCKSSLFACTGQLRCSEGGAATAL
jgi:hypothetical protein